MTPIYVFFAIGHPWHLRDCITRRLSRSHFGHVMVGDARGVFDSVQGGERVRPLTGVWMRYPGLQTVLEIKVPHAVNPREWKLGIGPRRFVPSLLRYLFGIKSARVGDCVQRVSEYLRESGVNVPAIYHAWDLYAHLKPLASKEHIIDDFHPVFATECCRVRGIPAPSLSRREVHVGGTG
jgi:hypothetical protein